MKNHILYQYVTNNITAFNDIPIELIIYDELGNDSSVFLNSKAMEWLPNSFRWLSHKEFLNKLSEWRIYKLEQGFDLCTEIPVSKMLYPIENPSEEMYVFKNKQGDELCFKILYDEIINNNECIGTTIGMLNITDFFRKYIVIHDKIKHDLNELGGIWTEFKKAYNSMHYLIDSSLLKQDKLKQHIDQFFKE